MSDYLSGNISFAGLGSGTDFNTMIDGLIKIERITVNRLQSWRKSWDDKITKFQELGTSLLSLQSTLKSMNTPDKFMVKSVTTSDADTLSATANSSAIVTAHTVDINQLAQNDIHVTLSGASSIKDSIFNTNGSFTFSYKGESTTISNIPANTTMEGFVNLINAHADSRNKIRATTINSGDKVHLQIYGLDLGAENQVTISNTSGMIFSPGNFAETQNAQNSKIKVDGFPPGASDWIERDTNTVSDVVDGLTLNLKKTTPAGSSINLGVTTDISGIKENIKTFVEENNKIRQMIKDLTSVTTSKDEAKGAILTGNYGVELLVGQRLKDVITGQGQGFSWYTDDGAGNTSGDMYSALSQLGIMTNADSGGANLGLLELDEEKLDKALNNDPSGVADLFSAYYAGSSSSPEANYLSSIAGSTKAGTYNVQYEISGGKLVSATINGREASINPDSWEITGKGGNPEAGLAIRVENKADGVHGNSNGGAPDAINVHLKLGKAGEMSEILKGLTGEDGPLKILEENYKGIIKNIDGKIEREERRITIKQQTLKDKFSRLDKLLGQYQGKQATLISQINKLNQK